MKTKQKVSFSLILMMAILLLCACGSEETWIGDDPELTMEYQGHRYQRVDDAETWRKAEFKCEEAGGHLVTITSQKEQDAVWKLIEKDAQYEVYWIGLRKNDNGDMTWITDEDMSFTNWAEGEPNGSGLYGQIFMIDSASGGHPGEWDDNYSPDDEKGQAIGFICEWDS